MYIVLEKRQVKVLVAKNSDRAEADNTFIACPKIDDILGNVP